MKCTECDSPAVGIFYLDGEKEQLETFCAHHAYTASFRRMELIKDLSADGSFEKEWHGKRSAALRLKAIERALFNIINESDKIRELLWD
jgi:hypothetical protein